MGAGNEVLHEDAWVTGFTKAYWPNIISLIF
jgi:hypothetical protein